MCAYVFVMVYTVQLYTQLLFENCVKLGGSNIIVRYIVDKAKNAWVTAIRTPLENGNMTFKELREMRAKKTTYLNNKLGLLCSYIV